MSVLRRIADHFEGWRLSPVMTLNGPFVFYEQVHKTVFLCCIEVYFRLSSSNAFRTVFPANLSVVVQNALSIAVAIAGDLNHLRQKSTLLPVVVNPASTLIEHQRQQAIRQLGFEPG